MKKLISLCTLSLVLTSHSQAVITTLTDDTPNPTGAFNEGGSNYFGVVNGSIIEGSLISSDLANPNGAIAGRDHDHGGRSRLVTASWSIGLPGDAVSGTGLSNISFSGIFAASQSWDNLSTDDDFVRFDLLVNGAVVSTLEYHAGGTSGSFNTPLQLDTNNDGLGDGITVTTTGIAINLSDSGGATITSATLRGSYDVNSGSEQHWTTGTLSADYDQVVIPEPSALALLGLGLVFGFSRRSRR